MFPIIDDHLFFLDTKIDTCSEIWKGHTKNFELKLISYLKTFMLSTFFAFFEFGIEYYHATKVRVEEELLRFVIKGEATDPLNDFFTQELYDNKILPRFDEVIFLHFLIHRMYLCCYQILKKL